MPEIHPGDDPSKLFAKADVIPLANLHRLDLKPGETLAVIAPDGITSVDGFAEFGRSVTSVFDELAIHVVVFPPGTKLDVVAPSTD